jgi:hypothetical protein
MNLSPLDFHAAEGKPRSAIAMDQSFSDERQVLLYLTLASKCEMHETIPTGGHVGCPQVDEPADLCSSWNDHIPTDAVRCTRLKKVRRLRGHSIPLSDYAFNWGFIRGLIPSFSFYNYLLRYLSHIIMNHILPDDGCETSYMLSVPNITLEAGETTLVGGIENEAVEDIGEVADQHTADGGVTRAVVPCVGELGAFVFPVTIGRQSILFRQKYPNFEASSTVRLFFSF